MSEDLIIDRYDLDKERILANKLDMYRRMTGIYFLIKGSELVYVGQSTDIMNRIAQHTKDPIKDFDSYSIIECPYEYLTTLEAHFIYKFRPRLNAVLPPNQLYKSFNQIKRHFDLSANVVKLWIRHKGIQPDSDGLYLFSVVCELQDFVVWMKDRYPNIYLRQCSVGYLREYLKENVSRLT